MKAGFSFSEADEMDAEERLAWCIAFGEAEGGTFDWKNERWSRA